MMPTVSARMRPVRTTRSTLGPTMQVRIGILGPLQVRVGSGEPVEVVGPRLRTLLIRLALDPGRVVLVDQLVDAIWDEDPPVGATNALQSLVARLRRQLPDVVQTHQAGYRLAVDPDAVDAVRFQGLVAAGRRQLAGDPWQAGRTLREALGLWRGPALADAATARFAAAAVTRLEELRLGAVEDRIEADLATGDHDAVLAELDELVTAHPLRERPYGQLMRTLATTGRQADALAAYKRLRQRLADELGIDPSGELQALHVAVLRGEAEPPADPGPRRAWGHPLPRHPELGAAPAASRTNLRAPITSFVGRDDDLARITAALHDARLVTLTGPGGAGKTRLAGEAAARLLDRMPDGVWMVELGSVAAPVDLPQALLSLFGAREIGLLAPLGASAVPPMERLEEAIGGKRLLLVLDNCEHLIAAVAALVDRLLARCPELRVLATSREPLGLPGEVLHPVGPLAMPAQDVSARLRALTVEQIAGRLDDRFRLLGDGSRRALARHQTLRAVIDWSWDLLGDDERVLLRRLAVFAGGATLQAVEQVCAAPGLGGPAPEEVLYLLATLVDKSLLVAAEDADGEVRYRMLETVRAYGEERRRKAGEDQALRRGHAGYFLVLAQRADPWLRRGDQLAWIARLAAERDNLHAALRWRSRPGTPPWRCGWSARWPGTGICAAPGPRPPGG